MYEVRKRAVIHSKLTPMRALIPSLLSMGGRGNVLPLLDGRTTNTIDYRGSVF